MRERAGGRGKEREVVEEMNRRVGDMKGEVGMRRVEGWELCLTGE